MNFKCALGLHEWLGCICSKCGKTRNQEHDWSQDCEKCTLCGTTRQNAHTFDHCKCKVCGKMSHNWLNCERCNGCGATRENAHVWDRCKCKVCGLKRDQDHEWTNCKCKLCGETRDEDHQWVGCKCNSCGKTRDAKHDFQGGKCSVCGEDLNLKLLAASGEGDYEAVADLLKKGAAINAIGPVYNRRFGWALFNRDPVSALYAACHGLHREVVQLLIAANADVNVRVRNGETPLHISCADCVSSEDPDFNAGRNRKRGEVVKCLVAARAEVNVQDDYGNTPLINASKSGSIEAVRLLLEANAQTDLATKYGQTALIQAYQHGHLHIVRHLISAKADVNTKTQDNEAKTPLFMACDCGHNDIAKMLIDAHANVNARMSEGMTALWMASVRGNVELVKMLIDANADVNHKLDRGGTALKDASNLNTALNDSLRARRLEVVKLLQEAGARDDTDEKNECDTKQDRPTSSRAECLRVAVAAFDRGDLVEAANALEKSDNSIDRENALNCRNLACGGAANMVQTLGYLLRQHLQMVETFKE